MQTHFYFDLLLIPSDLIVDVCIFVIISVEVDKAKIQADKEKKKSESKGGFWSGWFGKSSSAEPEKKDDENIDGKLMKTLEADLTAEERQRLFEVIDYQENAHHSIYPKDFVAYKLAFRYFSIKYI